MFKGSVARSYGRQLQGTPLASERIRRDLKWNLSISSMVRSPQIYSLSTSKKVKVGKFTSNNGHRSRFAINIGLKQLIWGYLGHNKKSDQITGLFFAPARQALCWAFSSSHSGDPEEFTMGMEPSAVNGEFMWFVDNETGLPHGIIQKK